MAAGDEASVSDDAASETKRGFAAAIGAYGTWGFFPVLFRALDSVDSIAVVANRVVWSFLLVGGILWNRGRLGEVRAALSNPRAALSMLTAALLLSVNWLVFVWGAANERVLEISFGYFINPLVSIAIGMALLGERSNRWQSVAIGVALIAVAIQAAGLGQFPWVSLVLAGAFGFYGYIRKTVDVGSAPGLFIECLLLLPISLGYIVFQVAANGWAPYADPWLMTLLVMTGPATSGALIMFAFAARRLPLSMMGMFQYIAPSMHFVIAILWFGEDLNMVQLGSFVLIWCSLAIYSADSWQRGRAARRRARLDAAATGPR